MGRVLGREGWLAPALEIIGPLDHVYRAEREQATLPDLIPSA